MISPIQWTWVWASSRSWWRTGKPVMLQFMRLQRVRHNWATEQQQLRGMWVLEKRYSCPDLVSDHKADNEVRRMSEAKARAACYGGSTEVRLRVWLAERAEDAWEHFQKCMGKMPLLNNRRLDHSICVEAKMFRVNTLLVRAKLE